MSTKIAFTAQGTLMGDFNEGANGYTVENPVYLIPQGGQGLALFPILGMTEQKTLNINKEDILFNGELFDPVSEIRNHYSSQFGSGVQLLTS